MVKSEKIGFRGFFETPPPARFRFKANKQLPDGLKRAIRTKKIFKFISQKLWRFIYIAPILSLLILCITFWIGNNALLNKESSSNWLMDKMESQKLVKPIERVLSWIEFNAKQSDETQSRDIEFADTGLQVMRSRQLIKQSQCSSFKEFYFENIEQLKSTIIPSWVNKEAKNLVAFANLPKCTDSTAIKPNLRSAYALPEVHNDFIGAWLFMFYGIDGVIIIAILQSGLIFTLLVVAFFTHKWSAGHRKHRVLCAGLSVYVIAFAMLIFMQWLISWMNTLGLLPVMGQPATFLSHGLSHLLTFGAIGIGLVFIALQVSSTVNEKTPQPNKFIHKR